MSDDTTEQQQTPPINLGRRRLCQVAIGGMTAATIGTVAYPIVSFLKLPKSMTQQEAMEVDLNELEEGSALWGEHMGRQIVVVKLAGDVRAFNGACPHLGCIVQWDGPSRTFKCPCHGAAFSEQGEPISGPVNAPLKPIEFKIKDGVLEVT